jgi:hypothetical protein
MVGRSDASNGQSGTRILRQFDRWRRCNKTDKTLRIRNLFAIVAAG